jgi:heme/copper-type cytochrome/quinol oxidase subunit 4
MLTTLLKDRTSYVWLGLVLATLASWLLGVGHDLPHQYAAVAIIVIACAKVHFVGRYFMELREAPKALMAVFDGWVCVVCSVLIGLYLLV